MPLSEFIFVDLLNKCIFEMRKPMEVANTYCMEWYDFQIDVITLLVKLFLTPKVE